MCTYEHERAGGDVWVSAAGVSHEPHGPADPAVSNWSRAGGLRAAHGETEDLRPRAAVTHILWVPYCTSRLWSRSAGGKEQVWTTFMFILGLWVCKWVLVRQCFLSVLTCLGTQECCMSVHVLPLTSFSYSMNASGSHNLVQYPWL